MIKDRRYTTEETVARGEAIYKRKIRSKVEPEHLGRYLAVDITMDEYSISDNELAAFDHAERKNPNGWFYVNRVGREAIHRIGSAHLSTNPSP